MGLLFCILNIILVLNIGYLLRRILEKSTHHDLRIYFNEMISTYEFSTFVFELGVFGRVYGVHAALLAAFCLLLGKNYKLLFQGRTVNPCGLVEYLFTTSRRRYVLILWLMQVLGALVSYFYIALIWRIFRSYHHLAHLQDDMNPQLKVGIFLGFVVELLATFLCTFVEIATRKKGYSNVNPCLNAVTCITVAHIFADTTGVWMNPALATVHSFELRNNLVQNILVYWLGPITGAALVFQYNDVVNNATQTVDKKGL